MSEKTTEELKKEAKEYADHRNSRFSMEVKITTTLITSLIQHTSPMEWDASYLSDGQEVVFAPIRIPKMFTDIFDQSRMDDTVRSQIKQCLAQDLLMEALSSYALKNSGISPEDLKKMQDCPSVDEALEMADKIMEEKRKNNGRTKGI